MSTRSEQVWLTTDAHDRLTRELAALLAQRENGDAGEIDVTTQEQREIRIRQLQEVSPNAVVHEPPDDGVVEPGMVLTVRCEGRGRHGDVPDGRQGGRSRTRILRSALHGHHWVGRWSERPRARSARC